MSEKSVVFSPEDLTLLLSHSVRGSLGREGSLGQELKDENPFIPTLEGRLTQLKASESVVLRLKQNKL